ncbi:MAG: hypothetical protein ABIL07_03510, partial [candidate division WOR-3 bacterium]
MQLLLNLNNTQLLNELKDIGVATEAYPIFLKKSAYRIIKIEKLSPAQANILKQIALICGGDVAIPKNAYFGSEKRKFDVLLFANLREIEKINHRLEEQPWMMQIRNQLSEIIKPFKEPILKIGNEEIKFERTYIMGIINISPDSFYSGSRYTTISTIKKV